MSWRNQTEVYLIMWQSKRSGATLTELRRTKQGLENFLQSLAFMGYGMDEITIRTQGKPWLVEEKSKPNKRKEKPMNIEKEREFIKNLH